MEQEDTEVGEAEPRYCIDLGWYGEQGRSFVALARSRLCPHWEERHSPLPSDEECEAELIAIIMDCCSKEEGFVTSNLPLLELVFRLFLANGNKPMDLVQIQEGLQGWLEEASNSRNISLPVMKRIIEGDRYYGLRICPEEES